MKHFQINSQFEDIDSESPIVMFFFNYLYKP